MEKLKEIYDSLVLYREPFLDRARSCSLVTIPAIFPEEGANGFTDKRQTYQSLGAQAVNTLAAKILTAVFPPDAIFFTFDIDYKTRRDVLASAGGDITAGEQLRAILEGVREQLAEREKQVSQHMSASHLRSKLQAAVVQLIIGGNTLIHVKGDKSFTTVRLDNFVVQRDSTEKVIQVVYKENVHISQIPEAIRNECEAEAKENKTIPLYTGAVLQEDGTYKFWQECSGYILPDSEQEYSADDLPLLPISWGSTDGDSYSDGYVYQYAGDLQSAEGLSKSIVLVAAAASKVVFTVRPGAVAKVADLVKVPNGGYVVAEATDISAIQVNKTSDFNVSLSTYQVIEGRIRSAFLMTSAIQRNGERVTAEEIRRLANELEEQLGGVYSLFAETLQRPLLTVIISEMERKNLLPEVPKGAVAVSITTGLAALGRSAEADRLLQFKMDVFDIPGAMEAVRLDTLVRRFATARGVDTTDLIKSSEQIQMERDAAAEQQFMMEAGVRAAPQLAEQAMAEGQTEAQPPQ